MRNTVSAGGLPSTSRLIAEAAVHGVRPPVQLAGPAGDGRGWALLSRADTLYADEFGDLWWGRKSGTWGARLLRPCWPEEARSLSEEIEVAVNAILG